MSVCYKISGDRKYYGCVGRPRAEDVILSVPINYPIQPFYEYLCENELLTYYNIPEEDRKKIDKAIKATKMHFESEEKSILPFAEFCGNIWLRLKAPNPYHFNDDYPKELSYYFDSHNIGIYSELKDVVSIVFTLFSDERGREMLENFAKRFDSEPLSRD